jgi:hypothetical protein
MTQDSTEQDDTAYENTGHTIISQAKKEHRTTPATQKKRDHHITTKINTIPQGMTTQDNTCNTEEQRPPHYNKDKHDDTGRHNTGQHLQHRRTATTTLL